MIMIRDIDGRMCPLFYCDACHKEITEFRLGMAVWSHPREIAAQEPKDDIDEWFVYHAHKGHCWRNLEGHIGKSVMYDAELSEHVVHLFDNTFLGLAKRERNNLVKRIREQWF